MSKNVFKFIIITILFCGCVQSFESSSNDITGKWKYNYIDDERKVFEVHVYEFKKDHSFTLKILDHSDYSNSISSETSGEAFEEASGKWKKTDVSLGVKLDLTFGYDIPSSEFGYGVYTKPDTTKILPSTFGGHYYYYYHFSSGIITLITDETFLLDLDRSATKFKDNPIIFNKIKS
mgnify:CR=1 FL=1|tara:strand:- start:740 stop:1270 length:531 start_codon:yes stop_codon:yes gene_type:complete